MKFQPKYLGYKNYVAAKNKKAQDEKELKRVAMACVVLLMETKFVIRTQFRLQTKYCSLHLFLNTNVIS